MLTTGCCHHGTIGAAGAATGDEREARGGADISATGCGGRADISATTDGRAADCEGGGSATTDARSETADRQGGIGRILLFKSTTPDLSLTKRCSRRSVHFLSTSDM